MPKLKKRIVRNKNNHKLEWKKIRMGVEVQEYIRDDFKETVQKNGKNMTKVLVKYMKDYVRKHQG